MTRAPTQTKTLATMQAQTRAVGEQFDLFLPYITDLNFRDHREITGCMIHKLVDKTKSIRNYIGDQWHNKGIRRVYSFPF